MLSNMISSRAVFIGSYFFTGGLCYWGLNSFTIHRVDGPSMRPTLNPDESKFRDWILVRQLIYPQQELIPLGKIICIKHPKKERGYLIKRLVANHDAEEDIEKDPSIKIKTNSKTIPKGYCWIESDSGQGFLDSTSYLGPISYKDVIGPVLCILWPPNRIRKL